MSVVNRALGLLGATKIIALGQDSKSAREANAIWTDVRDDVLRDHPWNSCKRRAQLAADATAPLFGWDNAFTWPAGCLRILAVNDVDWAARVGWEIEGRKILTNWAAPLDVEFIYQETDPNVWDPQLRSAIAFRLAAELAEPLTQQPEKQVRLLEAYRLVKTGARIIDGLEEDVIESELDDSWLSARYL